MKKKTKNRKITIIIGITVIGVIFMIAVALLSNDAQQVRYDVGSPGEGEEAPNIILPATDGSTFNLSDYEGQKVLLYFQEGIMCQACWVQLRDIENNFYIFEAMGIETIVTITTDPIGPLTSMVTMNDFETPVLSDNDVSISSLYNTNLYGMPGMGTNYNGHSFILVDEEGIIGWRADYGQYTMYVPLETLEEALKNALN